MLINNNGFAAKKSATSAASWDPDFLPVSFSLFNLDVFLCIISD